MNVPMLASGSPAAPGLPGAGPGPAESGGDGGGSGDFAQTLEALLAASSDLAALARAALAGPTSPPLPGLLGGLAGAAEGEGADGSTPAGSSGHGSPVAGDAAALLTGLARAVAAGRAGSALAGALAQAGSEGQAAGSIPTGSLGALVAALRQHAVATSDGSATGATAEAEGDPTLLDAPADPAEGAPGTRLGGDQGADSGAGEGGGRPSRPATFSPSAQPAGPALEHASGNAAFRVAGGSSSPDPASGPAPTLGASLAQEAPAAPAPQPATPVPTGDAGADPLLDPSVEVELRPTEPAAAAPARNEAPSGGGSLNGVRPALLEAVQRLQRGPDGTIRLVVRLDPPELGSVRVEISARGGEVHLALRADTPDGADALARQRAQVETLLREHGFDLDSFDVDARDRGQQREAQNEGPRLPFDELDDDALELPDDADELAQHRDGVLRL